MTRLSWSGTSDRQYETGLDRGVFYPNSGPAVAWNGLTSVDQKGADASDSFYMDGRPYLHLPKAKEFGATLSAYTYPDEFAECMGLVEAVDGMYLDSQQGDSFGLSYRTLIGSNAEGTSAGYKIHLVYNATVAPQGETYATLSDTLTPSDFSWEITAVPVPIEGFRATAHIIIDTRHLDATRIQQIEDLLYGTPSTVASLPPPQDLLDLLNFGSGIIITDNGDGTWTAEGSYSNVYMSGPGIFTIENVDAVTHGDGTYDISSTP